VHCYYSLSTVSDNSLRGSFGLTSR
jgi:hypothetical protein